MDKKTNVIISSLPGSFWRVAQRRSNNMAYLHKDDIVILRVLGGLAHARVLDIRFRKFFRNAKDKKTGATKRRYKSVPYAVCQVFAGTLPTGTDFLIPGYKLKNEIKDGEKLLILRNKYAADFDSSWARTLITESKNERGIA
jgi:hypothetical protein